MCWRGSLMNFRLLFLTLLVSVLGTSATWGKSMNSKNSKTVKTYLAFSLPVDPANVRTQPDLDISYALASTLVTWDGSMNLTSSMASSWESKGEKIATFHLSKNAKWSDGSQITGKEVVASFERAKKSNGDALKSLFDMVISIAASGEDVVTFTLNIPISKSGLFRKLTEPMYGILSIAPDGSINLKKSSGPFFLSSSTSAELRFSVNPHWYAFEKEMPEAAEIQQPPKSSLKEDAFLHDTWANLVPASSLIPEEISKKYANAQIGVWKRNLDKIYLLTPSTRLATEDGRALLRALTASTIRSNLVKDLSGFTLSEQFYPPGYTLHHPEFSSFKKSGEVSKQFKTIPLEVLMVEGTLSDLLNANLAKSIKAVTGLEPKINAVPLGEIEKYRIAGNFDLLAASIPVNDLNLDGSMAFFFGLTPPLIPGAGLGANDFRGRIETAKHLESQSERNLEYRKVMAEATASGCLVPLFHFSTVVVAKEGIEISPLQTSDETIAFSKVRFR
jgi:ABC-type oligopeptide transport system substrate-binding subunit